MASPVRFSANALRKLFFKKVMPAVTCMFYLVCCGCGDGDTRLSDCAQKGFDANCCPKPDTSAIVKPSKIAGINIFVETSGSMAGYMPKDGTATDFQEMIPELTSSLNTNYPGKVHFYSIFDSKKQFDNLPVAEARDRILKGDFQWSGNTYLPEMLDSVCSKYLKDGYVNIFISDCIYDPAANDNKSTMLAATDIRDELKNNIPEFPCDIFSFYSVFKSKRESTSRSPYYMVLQGQVANVNTMRQLVNISAGRYHQSFNEVSFGLNYGTPGYSVLPFTERSKNFRPVSSVAFSGAYVSLQDIEYTQEAPAAVFWLALDLSNLPSYAKDPAYINNNLEITDEHGQTTILSVSQSPPTNTAADDIGPAKKYTHFIRISAKRNEDRTSTIKLALKYERPAWVAGQDEADPGNKDKREKTFGLAKIVAGIEQASGQDAKAYLFKNLTLSLIEK
jgi:hypothetical protein